MQEAGRYEMRTGEVVAEVIAGDAVVINLVTGIYYSLDGTGGHAWALLQHGHTSDEVAAALAERYEVDADEAKADVDALVAQLLEDNLIREAPAPSARRWATTRCPPRPLRQAGAEALRGHGRAAAARPADAAGGRVAVAGSAGLSAADGPGPAAEAGALDVSVVIPALNAAGHIGATLESVLAQTRPVLEVIVVDDGSSDGTAEIAAAAGEPVRVLRNETASGPALGRNRGIAEARGGLIALLDADDLWIDAILPIIPSARP